MNIERSNRNPIDDRAVRFDNITICRYSWNDGSSNHWHYDEETTQALEHYELHRKPRRSRQQLQIYPKKKKGLDLLLSDCYDRVAASEGENRSSRRVEKRKHSGASLQKFTRRHTASSWCTGPRRRRRKEADDVPQIPMFDYN
mmetsp:Transcript_10090/g.15466  ORF Transcript_10090/g.15466 Transcript_10090/m.15466 type:complete len:143 (-) Transcript_10090:124-552(-)|eukprot:CAMPEP_0118682650 /NCGR_PEP_ID=MMETSP0800-20121206/5596_1 /TAXON_ID=210618 ORGANISM="Striatella unipunctata, Strain CCMP2910" /NCGR_SAMPLE_ID=MMETSP0800 /ASSEMBLY_ACC=CAM_ASM_000638 /LENGTH=142 /DNA_ID=CAMNT_0006579049 /DNA_START=128 /DNA_END=556 /DNA_ORIENTATION=-